MYFAYSAALRLQGQILDLGELTARLGVAPTHSHRKGDLDRSGIPYQSDLWLYVAAISKKEILSAHIDELWRVFEPRTGELLQLKQTLTIDIFLSYTSNCDHCGFEVPFESLKIFAELQVPFGVSVIVV